MKWYDIFSGFYDNALEKLYFDSRKRAAELLDLKNAESILDLACGTGANFAHIRSINSAIALYGSDYSEGMLRKAQSRVEKNGWENTRLFQADARQLTARTIENYTNGTAAFDRIICALGLSVIPEWETVLDNMIGLLKKDGRIAIIDVYAEKRNINSRFVEKLAEADLNRKIWQALERKTDNFHREYMPVSELRVGGKLFVATGIKRG